jgi:hypothetical protein
MARLHEAFERGATHARLAKEVKVVIPDPKKAKMLSLYTGGSE